MLMKPGTIATRKTNFAGSINDDLALEGALLALEEFVNWERQQRCGMRAACGVQPVADILSRLENPQLQFKSIHVAGTKGKGTVSAFIEGAMAGAGMHVGRYSSPHVECFTERLSLDRRSVPKRSLALAIRKTLEARNKAVRDQSPGSDSTWFDLVTAACFLVLGDDGVDWAVVECGLGGRLDSTNVIDAPVAVITNIDLEHTEVLGSTPAEIAREKAGIIKPESTVISGVLPRSDAGLVIQKRAIDLGCQFSHIPVDGHSVTQQNALLAKAVLDAVESNSDRRLGKIAPLSSFLTPATIKKSALPGRLEYRYARTSSVGLTLKLPVVLDGAHVPSSLELVLAELSQKFGGTPCTVLFGLNSDKDAEGMVDVLARYADSAIMTKTSKRSTDPAALCRIARRRNLVCDCQSDPTLAFEEACRKAENGWVFVTGSLYLIGAVRQLTF